MKSKEEIHVLARAIICLDNKLLVTTDTARNVSFLPGGHIHYGEKAKDALKRELKEELGIELEVNKLLGVIEAGWDYQGSLHHEYNLIFQVNTLSLKTSDFNQVESGLKLEWVPLKKVEDKNIFPRKLRDKIDNWINNTNEVLFETEWIL